MYYYEQIYKFGYPMVNLFHDGNAIAVIQGEAVKPETKFDVEQGHVRVYNAEGYPIASLWNYKPKPNAICEKCGADCDVWREMMNEEHDCEFKTLVGLDRQRHEDELNEMMLDDQKLTKLMDAQEMKEELRKVREGKGQ